MSSVNKVILIGYLGRDPELRHTTSGQDVCNFSIATTEKWKDKQGVKQEKTEWHNIVVWGRTAENCAEYLNKGSLVYLEGKLQTSNYEKDGAMHYKTEVVVERVQFLGGKDVGAKPVPQPLPSGDEPPF